MQVREGVDVRLLHHVLDLALVVHDRPRHSIHTLIVPAHEDFEQRAVTGAHAPDDFLIRQRRRRCGRDRRIGQRHAPLESRTRLTLQAQESVTFSSDSASNVESLAWPVSPTAAEDEMEVVMRFVTIVAVVAVRSAMVGMSDNRPAQPAQALAVSHEPGPDET